jgi:hypothetical protein
VPQPDQSCAETVARLVTQVTPHRERLTTLEQRADAAAADARIWTEPEPEAEPGPEPEPGPAAEAGQ